MDSIPNEIILNILELLNTADLPPCRFVNQRWNEILTEILGKKISIRLLSKMEAKYFIHVIKHMKGKAFFRKVKLALNGIPLNVLEELVSVLAGYKVQYTFFQMKSNKYSLPDTLSPQEVALTLLTHLPNITVLKVKFSARFIDIDDFRIGIQVLQANLPIFHHLTTIIWNTDTELLPSILKRALGLQSLQIEKCYDSQVGWHSLSKVSNLLGSLPLQTTIKATLSLYGLSGPSELHIFRSMCDFPNTFSNLTLQGDFPEPEHMRTGDTVGSSFLASQSGSLKMLQMKCPVFQIPRLESLEEIKIVPASVPPAVRFQPAMLPSLKKVELNGIPNVLHLFTAYSWENVHSLELYEVDGRAVPNEILTQIGASFPNLEKLLIGPVLFLGLMRFCRQDYLPIKELCVQNNHEQEWGEAEIETYWLEFTGAHARMDMTEEELLSGTFAAENTAGRADGYTLFGSRCEIRKMSLYACSMRIVHCIVAASHLGKLKLHTLVLSDIELKKTEHQKYWKTLSKYHDIVVLEECGVILRSDAKRKCIPPCDQC